MHKAALQPYGYAPISARRVHMPRLIMHTVQYTSCRKRKRPPSLNDRCRPTDTIYPSNTTNLTARAVRHAAQINARAHSRPRHCLVPERALNQPVLMPHAAS